MLRLNGHLNLKLGHSLDSTCPYLAPNCRKLPFLGVKFPKFSRGTFSRAPVADPRGLGDHAPLLDFFLNRNEVKEEKY